MQEITTTTNIELSPTVLEYFTKKILVRKSERMQKNAPLKESQEQRLSFQSFWSSLVWYSAFFLDP